MIESSIPAKNLREQTELNEKSDNHDLRIAMQIPAFKAIFLLELKSSNDDDHNVFWMKSNVSLACNLRHLFLELYFQPNHGRNLAHMVKPSCK